jgi:Uma2 family endonuclease
MSPQPVSRLTSQEYLVSERDSEQKHEFYRGEMFAMGGASFAHNQITTNIGTLVNTLLRNRDCAVTLNDLRVKITATGLYTYPDVVVTCESPKFEDEESDTLLNPQVIMEVLSKSTESYDRGKKFEHYRQIESLREYVLVAQDRPQIERFSRQADRHWLLDEASGLDAALHLTTIDVTLKLADVYAKVQFPQAERDD